jgi:hypothetical protein
MNDSIEFTPREKFKISLYKDPSGLFRRSIVRRLWYLIPSAALVAYSLVSRDYDYLVFGYGILFFQAIYHLTLLKRGLLSMSSIIRKYEAQLQNKQTPPP